MNATQDITIKSANCPATTAEQLEQRAKNLRSFQEKYDAMLYIVEFIASFHLGGARDSRQPNKMDEVKSLVQKTRNGLGMPNRNTLISPRKTQAL